MIQRWNTIAPTGSTGLQVDSAPTPTGPSGKRASRYNGLAESSWAGSTNKPAAATWVDQLFP